MIIDIKNLIKQYKNGVKALNGFDLTVKEGEIFTLLGPNGAGKSSLINILTTYYNPTSGLVKVLGKDIRKHPKTVRSQISCVAQRTSIDYHLSLYENMLFQSKLHRVDSNIAKERISDLIEVFDLDKYLNYPTASYSGGVKRRLDIAMNLVSYPKILFLDEPTVGMDVKSRRAMWDMITRIKSELNTTIFLTTHYLEEAEILSDSVCIIDEGRNIVQGPPKELGIYLSQDMINLSTFDSSGLQTIHESLVNLDVVDRITRDKDSLNIYVRNSKEAIMTISERLLGLNMPYKSISCKEPSLEDIFLGILYDSNRDGRVSQ